MVARRVWLSETIFTQRKQPNDRVKLTGWILTVKVKYQHPEVGVGLEGGLVLQPAAYPDVGRSVWVFVGS